MKKKLYNKKLAVICQYYSPDKIPVDNNAEHL